MSQLTENTGTTSTALSGIFTTDSNYTFDNTSSNSILTIDGTGDLSYPYTPGTISTGYSYTTPVIFSFESKDMAIDIDKLENMSEKRSNMLEKILERFYVEIDPNVKELLFNTLDSYGLITDKKSLSRKAKISSINESE